MIELECCQIFSCLWSIHELFEQKKRVDRGWFPKKKKDQKES
ncbi:MAG: DUF4491 family protein [Lachnospiraceae bacterium]|nr:DUF4491 family protein [Lachnospiraceae bacterium]